MAQIYLENNLIVEEYPFADEVHDMGNLIENRPDLFGNDVAIICKELQIGNSGHISRIDFLIYDNDLQQVGIVELKKGCADEKVLLQCLRYANLIRNNIDTVKYQIKRKNLEIDEEIIDQDSIKIIIIAPQIDDSLIELSQYISVFDFEFIQLQRFKDEKGNIYLITESPEVENYVNIGSRPRDTHSFDTVTKGLSEEQRQDIEYIINKIDKIIEQNQWSLSLRWLKNSLRYQTSSGRNAFIIYPRKTKSHTIKFCLGPKFDKTKLGMTEEIFNRVRHTKKTSRWWSLYINIDEINEYIPLMDYAYRNIS